MNAVGNGNTTNHWNGEQAKKCLESRGIETKGKTKRQMITEAVGITQAERAEYQIKNGLPVK